MADRHDIITLPNPALRKKSDRVHVITDDTHTLIADMRAAAVDWEESRPHEIAVALAAVQINRHERVIIVRGDFEDKNNNNFIVLINPEIVKREGEDKVDYEGCLSVSDIYGSVPRASKIRVKALDEHGQEIRLKAEDFLARVLQHEIDHTNGICFVDRIENETKAFYCLTEQGDLEPISYDSVVKAGLFR